MRTAVLVALIVVGVIVAILASGGGTFIGLGAIGWLGVWAAGIALDLLLLHLAVARYTR